MAGADEANMAKYGEFVCAAGDDAREVLSLGVTGLGVYPYSVGFGVRGLGFRVYGLGFKVQGLVFGASGLGFQSTGSGAAGARTQRHPAALNGGLHPCTISLT